MTHWHQKKTCCWRNKVLRTWQIIGRATSDTNSGRPKKKRKLTHSFFGVSINSRLWNSLHITFIHLNSIFDSSLWTLYVLICSTRHEFSGDVSFIRRYSMCAKRVQEHTVFYCIVWIFNGCICLQQIIITNCRKRIENRRIFQLFRSM